MTHFYQILGVELISSCLNSDTFLIVECLRCMYIINYNDESGLPNIDLRYSFEEAESNERMEDKFTLYYEGSEGRLFNG